MNVYFTGAQGTGKTTLANLLTKQGFEKIPSVTRSLIEQGKLSAEETSQGATPKTQKIIFDEYYKIFRERKAIVSDRFLTDVFAYTKFIYKRDDDEDALAYLHREREKIDQLAYEQRLLYGDADAVVFYCPIEFEVENDGLRDTDEEYRKNIDEYIKKELVRQCIRFHVLRGSVEERMETIKNILYQYI